MAEYTLMEDRNESDWLQGINQLILRDTGKSGWGKRVQWTDYDGKTYDRRTGQVTSTGDHTLTIRNRDTTAGYHIKVLKSTDGSTIFNLLDAGLTLNALTLTGNLVVKNSGGTTTYFFVDPSNGRVLVGNNGVALAGAASSVLEVTGAAYFAGTLSIWNSAGAGGGWTLDPTADSNGDLVFKDDGGAEIFRLGDTSSSDHAKVTGPMQVTGDLTVGGLLLASTYTARVYRSTNQSISDSTPQALTFDSERWDTGALHSTSANTDRLTAPVAGKYLITAHIQWASNATGERQLRVHDSSGNVLAMDSRTPISGNVTRMSIATVVELTAADYVTIVVYQSSGGALDVANASRNSPEATITKLP